MDGREYFLDQTPSLDDDRDAAVQQPSSSVVTQSMPTRSGAWSMTPRVGSAAQFVVPVGVTKRRNRRNFCPVSHVAPLRRRRAPNTVTRQLINDGRIPAAGFQSKVKSHVIKPSRQDVFVVLLRDTCQTLLLNHGVSSNVCCLRKSRSYRFTGARTTERLANGTTELIDCRTSVGKSGIVKS